MGCGCSGGTSAKSPTPQNLKMDASVISNPEDCDFDETILSNYKEKLQMVKELNLQEKTGITTREINSYLGVIQSALNYPDNYCLFENQLRQFQANILPILIVNVN